MIPRLAVLAVALLVAPGCATIVQGEHQSVPIDTNPSGAVVLVDGIEMGQTPTVLSLDRDEEHEVVLRRDGYRDVTLRLDRDFDFVPTVIGNLFSFGIFGFAVDYVTGAAYDLTPEQITRTLEAQGAALAPSGDPDQITVVLFSVDDVRAATGE